MNEQKIHQASLGYYLNASPETLRYGLLRVQRCSPKDCITQNGLTIQRQKKKGC